MYSIATNSTRDSYYISMYVKYCLFLNHFSSTPLGLNMSHLTETSRVPGRGAKGEIAPSMSHVV